MKKYMLFTAVALLSTSANAVQWIKGKVTSIEVTYLPAKLEFTMDTGNTACPAGKKLIWAKESWDNNKIIHSTVLAAMLASKSISFVINDNDTNCIGQFLYINND